MSLCIQEKEMESSREICVPLIYPSQEWKTEGKVCQLSLFSFTFYNVVTLKESHADETTHVVFA